jgi:hypothetical protein
MARRVFVDCNHRDPWHSVGAVLQQVRTAKAGSTVIVVRTDDATTVGLLREWSRSNGLKGTVEGADGAWRVCLYLVPDSFDGLPRVVRLTRAVEHATQALPLGAAA